LTAYVHICVCAVKNLDVGGCDLFESSALEFTEENEENHEKISTVIV